MKQYRLNVGILLLNDIGKIFCGKRIHVPLTSNDDLLWQLPQGGILEKEDPLIAAGRELAEETGIHSVIVIDQYPGWLTYEFPEHIRPTIFDGQFHGQKQLWFRMRFTGVESEINLHHSLSEPIEFQDWAWMTPEEILTHTVPFRRGVYEQLFKWHQRTYTNCHTCDNL